MFNLEEFKDNNVLENIAGRLNKYISKKKDEKVLKIVEELKDLWDKDENKVPVTYILSILAEEDFSYINSDIIEKIKASLKSAEPKLKLNTIIIIGFAMLNDSEYIKPYLKYFLKNLNDENSDIKENSYYFLQELVKKEPQILCEYKNDLLNVLSIEKNSDNLYSLLEFIQSCNNLKFNELFWFKEIFKNISLDFTERKKIKLKEKLKDLCKKFYVVLKTQDINQLELSEILDIVNLYPIIKKTNFSNLNNQSDLLLKSYINDIKKSRFNEEEIYFYVKNKESKEIYIYEIEKGKLLNFFNQDKKISSDLIKKFIYVIDSKSELKLVINTLINLKIIKGYFSELGYFYPYNYLKKEINNNLKEQNTLQLDIYNHLPKDILRKILKDITSSTNETLLMGKNKKFIYPLKKLNQEINLRAAKENIIDLSSYRELLTKKSFIKLIKNLPKDYLTKFRKGTILLTNLGLIKIKNEIDNSKILGYLSLSKISTKLNVNKILLVDVLDEHLDYRGGMFNKEKDIFYYSKFINNKIDNINLLTDKVEKEEKIVQLTDELNIQKDVILAKIDENLKLIGEEIKAKDQIKINIYLEKTGMNETAFFDFINSLNLKYLKKGDILIFNENKIKEAEREIKNSLREKLDSQEYILLSDPDATSSLDEKILRQMQEEEEIRGIFYKDKEGMKFYTQKGIEKLMLQDSFIFSFNDLFYGKELSEKEIELLKSILENLINSKRLKGNFNKQNLTFSSFEILFAQDYNGVLSEYEKMIKNYIEIFELEFQKIRKILTKRIETIFPQEIKEIQDIIDRINSEYVRWRGGIEAFIRRANLQLLKKQGYSFKKYRKMRLSTIKEKNIKLFEEDPEVVDLLEEFKSWIKLFNEIELKYGNVIFYQKRLINNPNTIENEKKLNSLLKQLKLL